MATRVEVRGLLLDLEGTLVSDKRYRLVPGVPEWFERVRREFVTGLPRRSSPSPRRALTSRLRRSSL
jgi:hypothetical protein